MKSKTKSSVLPKIVEFDEVTTSQLLDCFRKYLEKGRKKIILNIRGSKQFSLEILERIQFAAFKGAHEKIEFHIIGNFENGNLAATLFSTTNFGIMIHPTEYAFRKYQRTGGAC